ncbi:MAG: DUF2752 domain-containing protein [Verrucomicrobiota bacterium]
MSVSNSHREITVLVAPLATFLAVVLILVAAHFYERLPIQHGECGFLERTGIPCLACGGTRSMQALSHGQLRTAFSFHPAFALGAVLSPLWLFIGIQRYRRAEAMPPTREQNRRLKMGFLVASILLALNWIYLIIFLS